MKSLFLAVRAGLALSLLLVFSPRYSPAAEVDWQACKPYCIVDVGDRTATVLSGLNKMRLEVSVISPVAAQKLFNSQRQDDDLPFDFQLDGAYARSYVMGRKMEALGVVSAKAFIEGDLRFDSEEFGPVVWGYHVAPVVVVRQGGKVSLYVIDPNSMKAAVPYEEWRAFFLKKEGSRIAGEVITSRFAYTPYDIDDPSLADYDNDDWEDAVETNEKFKRFLQMYRDQRKQSDS